MNFVDRIRKLRQALMVDVYEKDEVFSLSLLAMLSGESIFLLGLPGVAKSLVSRRIKFAFQKGKVFEYLMNRFSTPEEIFGPINIEKLQHGSYERNIKGYLPDADIGFLDEIWKAGPAIQNTLLTIINEKIYRNGDQTLSVPLKLLIAASNELPESGQGLEALYDRFIIRYIVEPLQDENNFITLLRKDTAMNVEVPENLQFTSEEYSRYLKEIKKVEISQPVIQFILEFRKLIDIETNGEMYISDRRWKKVAHLLKSSAFYNERKSAEIADLLIIPHCLWDNEDEAKAIENIFTRHFTNYISHKILTNLEILKHNIDSLYEKIRKLDYEEEYKRIYKNYREYDMYMFLIGTTKHFMEKKIFDRLSDTTYEKVEIDSSLSGSKSIYDVRKIDDFNIDIRSKGPFKAETLRTGVHNYQAIADEAMNLMKLQEQVGKLDSQVIGEETRFLNQSNVFFDGAYQYTIKAAFNTIKTEVVQYIDIVSELQTKITNAITVIKKTK